MPKSLDLEPVEIIQVPNPKAMEKTKIYEGFSPTVYKDTVGKRTVGYGFNIDDSTVASMLPKDVVQGRRPIAKPEADKVFETLYSRAQKDAVDVVGQETYANLPMVVQDVLNDMSYNLGKSKLSGFHDAIGALKAGNYSRFADEIKDSKWFDQVGNRSREHYNVIKSVKKNSLLDAISSLNPFGVSEAYADEVPAQYDGLDLTPIEDSPAQSPQGLDLTPIEDAPADSKLDLTPIEEPAKDNSLRDLLAQDAQNAILPNRNVETIGRGLGAGIAGVVKAGGGLIDLVSQNKGEDNQVTKAGKKLEENFKPLPEDSPLVYEIAAAFGSSAPFMIPGIGVAGVATKAGLSVSKAAAVASGFSAVLESGIEAGGVAGELKDKGKRQEDINKAAAGTFATNLPLLFVTNKLSGIFNLDKGNVIMKVGKTAFFEGAQEGGQEAISNVATEKPVGENVAKAAALGGLVGGSVGGIMQLASNIDTRSEREKVFQQFSEDLKTGVIGFYDEQGNPIPTQGQERQIFDKIVAEAEKTQPKEIMTPQAQAIVDAQNAGKVIGIDAQTKLPIIDTTQGATNEKSKGQEASKEVLDVKNDIKDKLLKAGLDETQAEANAKLWEARASQAAKEQGITPQEWYAKNKPDVQKSEEAAPKGALKQTEQKADTFYSQAEKVINEKMPNAATPEMIKGILSEKNAVKKEELEWMGLDEFLAGKQKVSKAELQDFIKQNQVQIKEVEKGNAISDKETIRLRDELAQEMFQLPFNELTGIQQENVNTQVDNEIARSGESPTKFQSYQLPGGENYRELLLTLPMESNSYELRIRKTNQTKIYPDADTARKALFSLPYEQRIDAQIMPMRIREQFKSSHFDELNILAHVRMNDRTDADGKKVLFIEEVQSDWHQKGRKEGYSNKQFVVTYKTDGGIETKEFSKREDAEKFLPTVNASTAGIREIDNGSVPNAPFKKTWQELAMKRMLRYAAENGYDRIAWTTGEQQAERYDLSKQVNKIEVTKMGANSYNLMIDAGRTTIPLTSIKANELEEHIGKELAQKIINDSEAHSNDATSQGFGIGFKKTYSGLDLKVGGEGMKGFYDQILPAFMNKYAKKWGGRVGTTSIKVDQNVINKQTQKLESKFGAVHSLDITPSMRQSVLQEGQPLFQEGARGWVKLSKTEQNKITLSAKADASTFIHESAHIWLEDMYNNAKPMDNTWRDISQWLGIQPDQKKLTREQHEKFARGFEKYLREGRSPSEGLTKVFREFARWLKKIYKSVKDLNVEISNDVRRAMDRMLTGQTSLKDKKPGTLIGIIKKMGGISLEKAKQAGYTFQDFKEFGLISILRKGGQSPDDIAKSLINDNVLHNPKDLNPSDLLMQTLKHDKEAVAKEIDALEMDYDKEYAKWLKENENDLKIEPGTAEQLEKELTPNLEKESQSEIAKEYDWDGNEIQPEPSQEITPSGQIRLELMPPVKTELFQQEGEMFKKGGYGTANIDTFTEKRTGEKSTVDIKPVESIEMVKLAKELTGGAPFIKNFPKALGMFYGQGKGDIALNPELFKRGNEKQLAATLAHEIGHLIDYLPDQTLRRGNLLGRLLVLRDFLKNTFDGDIFKNELGESVSNKAVRAEMKELSFEWRPFDGNGSPSYVAYRNSSKEIYADFISALLNDPGLVKNKAPKAYQIFFENLDKKPDVKQAYFDVQQIINGKPEEIVRQRQNDIRRAFAKGEDLREALDAESKMSKINIYERIRQLLDDKYFPVKEKIRKAEGNGILPRDRSLFELEEKDLADNDVYLMLSKMDKEIMAPLNEAGITIADLGEYLFLKRVIGKEAFKDIQQAKEFLEEQGHYFDEVDEEMIKALVKQYADREDIANPLGFAPESAKKQLDFLKSQIGEEKFKIIEDKSKIFHDIIFSKVEEAVKVGSYNKETFDKVIKPNKDTYVSFGVLNYLQDKVPAGIKMQKGTLSDIENPFITTILKSVSLIRLNARQKAVGAFVDSFSKMYPGEITPSRKKFVNGAPVGYVTANGKGSVTLLEDGRVASYDVDPYIARSFEYGSTAMIETARLLNKFLMNKQFKGLVITYNLGFSLAFNPIRDFKRSFINLNALGQKITLGRLLHEYTKALPEAIKRQRGITTDLLDEMLASKALDIPFTDFNFDPRDDGYGRILRKYKVIGEAQEAPKNVRQKLTSGLMRVLEGVRFVGSVTESLGKVAGYNYLKNKGMDDRTRAWITRNYIGTPNFRTKGEISDVTNQIFIFSNIMKEGLKADMRLAFNPNTRSGWWLANFKVNIFPKMLMFAAVAGIAGQFLKDFFDKVPEYDKTNYIIVPLGISNGRAVYLRIPHDESSRLFAAMLWKVLNAPQNKDMALSNIFAINAGNLPSLSPTIEIGSGWVTYLSGHNPFDAFRGRNILPDTAYKAGGIEAFARMVQWSFNSAGFSQFTHYDDRRDNSFEAVLKATPGLNAVTRLIKVSDFGLTEKTMDINKAETKESARLTLDIRNSVEKFLKGKDLNTVINQASIISKNNAAGKEIFAITEKLYGPKYTRDNLIRVQNNLLSQAMRAENNPYVKAILSSQSNDAKAMILKEAKDSMSLAEYIALLDKLTKARIISKELRFKVLSD